MKNKVVNTYIWFLFLQFLDYDKDGAFDFVDFDFVTNHCLHLYIYVGLIILQPLEIK